MRLFNYRTLGVLLALSIWACHKTSPFSPIPLVLKAHVTGVTTNQNGQVESNVTVNITCPGVSTVGVPSSARLGESMDSDATGVFTLGWGWMNLRCIKPEAMQPT